MAIGTFGRSWSVLLGRQLAEMGNANTWQHFSFADFSLCSPPAHRVIV